MSFFDHKPTVRNFNLSDKNKKIKTKIMEPLKSYSCNASALSSSCMQSVAKSCLKCLIKLYTDVLNSLLSVLE
jgi:hypothetical protein